MEMQSSSSSKHLKMNLIHLDLVLVTGETRHSLLKVPCAGRCWSNAMLTDLVGGSSSSLPGASSENFCETSMI